MVEVRRRSLDLSLLDLSVSIQVCVTAEKIIMCVCVCVHANTLHVQTSKELLSCSSIHNALSLESDFFPTSMRSHPSSICFSLSQFPSFIPVLSCHSLVANQASSRIHGVAHDVGLRQCKHLLRAFVLKRFN